MIGHGFIIKPMCPECNSENIEKDGFDTRGNYIYICNDCGQRWNESWSDEV